MVANFVAGSTMNRMENLKLPFWIVTDPRRAPNPARRFPCNDPFALHAFTTAETLAPFLEAHKHERWDVTLIVEHQALQTLFADAEQRGATHICFDPDPDGSGGDLLYMADVLDACDQDEQVA